MYWKHLWYTFLYRLNFTSMYLLMQFPLPTCFPHLSPPFKILLTLTIFFFSQFLLYNEVNQLYVYTYPHPLGPLSYPSPSQPSRSSLFFIAFPCVPFSELLESSLLPLCSHNELWDLLVHHGTLSTLRYSYLTCIIPAATLYAFLEIHLINLCGFPSTTVPDALCVVPKQILIWTNEGLLSSHYPESNRPVWPQSNQYRKASIRGQAMGLY